MSEHMQTTSRPKGINNALRNIFAAILGNSFEWYDFALFGIFASTFSKLFFPEESLYTGMMKTYGIFAVGFVMRPLGSYILGFIGDKRGRKPAFLLSISLMAFPTICIGLLPTYHEIGIYAPILLIILRMIQGFALGGEYGGSMVFLGEHAPDHCRGYYSSWTDFGCLVGVLIGTLVGWSTHTFLSPDDFSNWGWRLPFLGSFLLGVLVFWIRKNAQEPTSFLQTKLHNERQSYNLQHFVFKLMLPAILIYAFGNVCFYLFLIFLPNYFIQKQLISPSLSLLHTSLTSALIAVVIPVAGYLSDKFGRKNLFVISILGVSILAYPLFYTMSHDFLLLNYGLQILFALALAFFYGGEAALFVEIFPVHIRFRALSLTLSISNMIFGGLTPLVATWLVEKYHDAVVISFMVFFFGFFSLGSLLYIFKQPGLTVRTRLFLRKNLYQLLFNIRVVRLKIREFFKGFAYIKNKA